MNYLSRILGGFMISIRKIRIVNFKSIEKMELIVKRGKTVFVGQNNAGKSNVNKAIDCVFNFRYSPSEYDVYKGINAGENCYIDIMISADSEDKYFNDDWLMIFGDKVVTNEFDEDSFTIRTVIYQNESSKRFEIDRFPILDWGSTEFSSANTSLPREIRKCIGSFYLNSNRDIVDELRIRNSNFSKLMKNTNFDLSHLDSSGVEKALEIVNRMILRKMPSISDIEETLSDISTTVDNVESLKILPIPNRFDDLDKGVEIQINNSNSTLPISVYGDGTRSWVSILTLSSYIDSLRNQLELEVLPYFAIILLEEPESHLHPQAQNKIISQLDKIEAQIFVTTHSSNIVSELGVFQLFRICNDGGTQLKTKFLDLCEDDELKIINFILPFHTEILFSDIVVLVEGISDKLMLIEYIKFKMKKRPFEFGISVVEVNSKDNLPIFRKFCEIHSIKNIIYADRDAETSLTTALTKKNLSNNNVIYTSEMDMELEIINEQFDVCKDLFIEVNNCSEQYISNLQKSGKLENKILAFLKKNKSQYPHWLFRSAKDSFNIKSFNSAISIIGRR